MVAGDISFIFIGMAATWRATVLAPTLRLVVGVLLLLMGLFAWASMWAVRS